MSRRDPKDFVISHFSASEDFRVEEILYRNASGGTISMFNYGYNDAGQITTWSQETNGGGKEWSIEYDAVDQLIAVKSVGSGGAVQRYAYAYDHAGNRIGEQSDGFPSLAKFNILNQLTNRVAGGPLRFKGYLNETGSVTVAGSRATMLKATNFVGYATTIVGTNSVQLTASDFSLNSTTNNYQTVVTNAVAAITLKYDANGNLTNRVSGSTNITYEWDAGDRLVAIVTGTNRSEFSYDGLGRRVRIVEKVNGVAQGTNVFLWCETELCEERDLTGGTVTKRFFGQGEQIAGTNYFFTRDHLGSIREVTGSTGTIHARYDYDPYGRRTKMLGDLEADFGFTGHYVHNQSGLHLAFYRAYDAENACWLSRDPVAEGGGLNLFGYAANDPVNRIDVLGAKWWGALAGAVVGGITGFVVSGGASLLLTAGTFGFNAPLIPAEVVLGTAAGAILGAIAGELLTSPVKINNWEDYLDPDYDAPIFEPKVKGRTKPKDCPPGTVPIDQSPWKDAAHAIKDKIGAAPNDWVGITPDGEVVIEGPDGKKDLLGPAENFVPKPPEPQ